MSDPYRKGASRAGEELVCTLPGDEGRSPLFSIMVPMGVGGIGAALLGRSEYPLTALPLLALTVFVVAYSLRRAKRHGSLAFRVDSGELSIFRKSAPEKAKRLRLGAVKNVRLESKSIRRVTTTGGSITEFVGTKVGPEVQLSRLVIVGESEEPVFEDFISYSLAVDMLGQVRSFLRRNGWEPADERAPTEADDGAPESEVPESEVPASEVPASEVPASVAERD